MRCESPVWPRRFVQELRVSDVSHRDSMGLPPTWPRTRDQRAGGACVRLPRGLPNRGPPQADLLDVGLGAAAGGEVGSPEALGGARAGCVHVNSGPGRTSFSDMHFLGF